MTENMKKFLKEVENNAELKARLSALPDEEASKKKVVEIAKEYGFTLTAEDCEVGKAENISDDELEAVAGGSCIFGGVENGCGCIFAGVGGA